jgi:hypothetical protein
MIAKRLYFFIAFLISTVLSLQAQNNDKEIGTILTRKELNQGRDFILDDGSKLTIRRYSSWYQRRSELHVLLNDKPVKGSMADPYTHIRRIVYFMLIIGGISIISGLSNLSLSGLKQFDIDSTHGAVYAAMKPLAYVSLCIGTGFVILALVVRQGSLYGMYAAMVLLVISISLRIYIAVQVGQAFASPALLLRLGYLAILWKGAEALKTIKAEEALQAEA